MFTRTGFGVYRVFYFKMTKPVEKVHRKTPHSTFAESKCQRWNHQRYDEIFRGSGGEIKELVEILSLKKFHDLL